MRADMTVYQPGDFLYNLLIKKSKHVINTCNIHLQLIKRCEYWPWWISSSTNPDGLQHTAGSQLLYRSLRVKSEDTVKVIRCLIAISVLFHTVYMQFNQFLSKNMINLLTWIKYTSLNMPTYRYVNGSQNFPSKIYTTVQEKRSPVIAFKIKCD